MIKFIGISGKRGSGKTLLARKLMKYGYQRYSLADPLKAMCIDLYGLTETQVYGVEKEFMLENCMTPRDILIREGALKRMVDKNFWCKQLRDSINSFELDKVVVDDIRFENEILFFRKEFPGAKFIRLERSEEDIGKKHLIDPSECDLDDYAEWDGLLTAQFNKEERDIEVYVDYLVSHL